MRKSTPPPDIYKVLEEHSAGFFAALQRKDVQKFLRDSVNEYLYWDTFRYRPMPKGVSPELAWALRHFLSASKAIELPLRDTRERSFSYWIPDSAFERIHRIDRRAAGPLMEEPKLLPSHQRDRIVTSSLMEEAIASSQIEGAATPRGIAKAMLKSGRRPRDKHERMILNNYRAMQKIRTWKNSDLTIEKMNELHLILTEDTLDEPGCAGRMRESPKDDDVVVHDDMQNVLHYPPKGRELPKRMERLLQYANNPEEGIFTHPVVKAIMLHFWIGHDHPYVDGNGRVGRALFYWCLLRNDYRLFEYLSISRIVHRSRKDYELSFLHSEAPGNDATYFLMYNLRVIDIAIEAVSAYIQRKQAEIESSAHLLRKVPGINHRQRELLYDAMNNPSRPITFKSHATNHGVSHQTARTDILGLTKRGLLDMVRSGRPCTFLPTKDLLERLEPTTTSAEPPPGSPLKPPAGPPLPSA